MNSFQIRDARDSDRQQILDVTLSAYKEYASAIPEWAWIGYRESIIATLGDVRPAEQIVAEQDGAVVGTVLLYPAGTTLHGPSDEVIRLPVPEVRLLAVAPHARRQGIGEALIKECIRRAGNAGVPSLTLHTMDMMQTAMRMYERIGFERYPEIDSFPAENVVVKGYRFDLSRTE